jgi:PAS domain S-box-containing protein
MSDQSTGAIVVQDSDIPLPTDPPRIRSQKLARITLDSMVQLVALLDAEGNVLDVNQVALDAAGVELSDVDGKPFWSTVWWKISDDVQQTVKESVARAAKGELVRWDAEIYAPARGRERITVDVSLRPVFDAQGNVVFICAEGRDITERNAQELARQVQELKAREDVELQSQLLHSLFMQAPMIILVLRGPDHVVDLANPTVARIWGRTIEEVLGRPLLEVLPELRGQVFPSLLDNVFRTGVPYIGEETPAVLNRGSGAPETVYFDFLYSPFRNVQGDVDGIFVIASDVTPQVVAREQIDGLREAAESASRAKDEFLAMLGHELRNPLSPILTALQLIKLQGPERSERAYTVIERQVNHLTRLVDDLLDVSRIARGKVELKIETVEIAEVVAKAIEMASPLLEQRNHQLTVDVPKHGLSVNGDPTRLSQVVSNLLTNAAKYTPQRGGRITVLADQIGDEVVLRVIDTGIGIAPDVIPRVFELFVQERQASDRSQGGLGIGLTIVRNLVERHGGSVSVRSAGPGRGSEFTVRLPRAERAGRGASSAAVSSSARDPAPRARGLRILIVDDNADGAEMLSLMLTHMGYETRVAHNGPVALRIAQEFRPKLALLDLGLPVMDGYELGSRLLEMPELAGIQLIAVTGYGQDSDRQKTRAAGFQQHLVKPVTYEALEAAVAQMVGGQRANGAR